MAEQRDVGTGDEQQELAEPQLIELGRDEFSDDNQLLPIAGNMSQELLEAIKESKGNTFRFEYNPTTHHTTNISGDVIKENIANIKDAKNIGKVGFGDEIHSKQHEQTETSEHQQYIGEGDEIEEEYETYEEQFRCQRGISSGGARRKIKQKYAETQKPWTFDSDSQTDKIQTRTAVMQTYKEVTFNTEVQTDDIVKRDRKLQTELTSVFDSDTQTSTTKSYHRSTLFQMNSNSQTKNIVLTNSDVQTDALEIATNETQTLIQHCQENGFQTEIVATASTEVQTSDNTESALELIEMYNNEHTEQNIDEFLPLFTFIWKSIQLKILVDIQGKKFLDEIEDEYENIVLSKFIRQVERVFKLGQKFEEENNTIHALVAFYSSAKLHKLKRKSDESVFGVTMCVDQIRFIVETNFEQLQKLVVNHVIPLLHDCVKELSNIKNANPDNVVIKKA